MTKNNILFYVLVIFTFNLNCVELSNIVSSSSVSSVISVGQSKCMQCLGIFDTLIPAVQSGDSDDKLKSILHGYCPAESLHEEIVCDGSITVYFPTIKYIIKNQPDISASLICNNLLQSYNSCVYHNPYNDWTIHINSPSGELTDNFINPEFYQPLASNIGSLKILHLTDFHYDPLYEPGASENCKKRICCHNIKKATKKKNRAGKWGSYRHCDMPFETIEHTISHIAETHQDIDYIYVTGDYSGHEFYNTTWPKNFYAISKIFDKLVDYFPTTPIYPLLGNHEPTPMDVFAPPHVPDKNISTMPLYNYVSTKWSWLTDYSKETIRNGGYYSTIVQPGLRLIALNNNICMTHNWWLVFSDLYLVQPLSWLQSTLFDAEKNGEKVHILAHVPSGYESCHRKWSSEFNKIVERYKDTITAQFNGHTHRDQFYLHFAKEDPFTPINVAWNGGSISTWLKVNSNYKIYSVESATFHVTDVETWIFNLTEANSHPNNTPKWFLEYKFRDAYNLTDLSPVSLYNFTLQMAQNSKLMHKYWKYYVKHGDQELHEGCNRQCLANELCKIVTTEFMDNNPRCPLLANIYFNTTKNNLSLGSDFIMTATFDQNIPISNSVTMI